MTTSAFEEVHLQTLLEKIAEEEGFQSPKFEISTASKPGDNFIGRIYRAVITETSKINNGKSLPLIFKASPLNQTRRKMMATDQIFQLESEVYQKVLPTLNKLLNKHGVMFNTFPGTARCLAARINEPDSDQSHVVVLEDKSVDGFGLFQGENKTLDAKHCRLILKRLSLLHAASMALYHYEPETAEELRKMLRKDGVAFNDANHPIFAEVVRGGLAILKELQGRCKNEQAFDKLKNLTENYAKAAVEVNQPSKDVFCILHGDCWTNNILFKYNKDGVVEDACLIDLQLSRVASPAIDLVYMIFLCTTKEVRGSHYDELIRYYHDEVSHNLRTLGCDPKKVFPWELLQNHLTKLGWYGVPTAVFALPVLAAQSSEIKVDAHSDQEGDVFIGSANVTDPDRQEQIWRRIIDVIDDAVALGYL